MPSDSSILTSCCLLLFSYAIAVTDYVSQMPPPLRAAGARTARRHVILMLYTVDACRLRGDKTYGRALRRR